MSLKEIAASAAYHLGLTRLPYAPLLVSLEPTNYCNLRCPMCPVGHHATDPSIARGFMDEHVFVPIMHDLLRLKPVVAFHMGGESLLHPNFFSMAMRLVQGGITVRLDTNGMLLSSEICETLIKGQAISEIYIDLDGTSKETYERIRKRAKFDRVVDNIRCLLETRKRLGVVTPRIILKNIQHFSKNGVAAFPDSYKNLFQCNPPDEFRFAWADIWPGTHSVDLKKTGVAYAIPPISKETQKCMLLWTRLAIGWDGTAFICCLDLNRTMPIGSAHVEGVSRVWNSRSMIEARRTHVQGRQRSISLCANCNQIRRPAVDTGSPFSKVSISRDGGQGGEKNS